VISRLRDVTDLPAFEFRWPEETEQFTRGWQGTARAGSRPLRVEHAVGARDVYGRHRVHTVTFVNGQPSIEVVAADDFERSKSLLSLIKPGDGHRLAKNPSDVPPEYAELEVVNHRDEIDAPYSKRCLALKIPIDDLDAWTLHAVRRFIAQGR
jgi:hypothetical protein